MTKQELLTINNFGIANITNHTLEPAQAYKVVKFRKALSGAIDAYVESEKAILKDAGIDDGQAFDNELVELRKAAKPSKEQKARLEEMEAKLKRYNELRAELLKEEVKLDCKTMPYDAWHQLRSENKDVEINGKKIDLLPNFIEDILEGVLWEAPKEEN